MRPRTKDFRLMNDYYKWLGPILFLLSICYSLRKAFLWVGKPQWLYFNLIDWFVGWLVGWLIVWMLGWLFDWLIGWWTDWLMDWLIHEFLLLLATLDFSWLFTVASWLLQQRISRNPYTKVGNLPPQQAFQFVTPKNKDIRTVGVQLFRSFFTTWGVGAAIMWFLHVEPKWQKIPKRSYNGPTFV